MWYWWEHTAYLSVTHFAFQNLLQEVTDIEKDLLNIVILKDSITASSTAEAQANLSQQVDNLQNHKGALDYSIRESLALFKEKTQQKVQPVEPEVSCIKTALKDLADVFGNLRESRDGSLDIRELKQKWYIIQVHSYKILFYFWITSSTICPFLYTTCVQLMLAFN